MNSLVSRMFHVADMSNEQVKELHQLENKIGSHLYPNEIERKWGLPVIGEISEYLMARLERQILLKFHELQHIIMSGTDKTEADYKKGNLPTLHELDHWIKSVPAPVDFSGADGIKSDQRNVLVGR